MNKFGVISNLTGGFLLMPMDLVEGEFKHSKEQDFGEWMEICSMGKSVLIYIYYINFTHVCTRGDRTLNLTVN